VKAITDNFENNIDGANTFDKNVKFSLTTDYKPYSTFTADSKTHGKTWAMVDDVQDGAYMVDDNQITMKDSTGKDVKDLFNMYHVLSEKERTQEIQNILKEAGLNPKGEFYMFVAKDSASFYKNYVRQAKNITIDLPAHLLVEKGQIVKNDFHQIDFGNGYVSNLVTVQVPNLKPEKHALDHKDNSKVRDGQEIQIGEYLRYLLDGVTVPAKHDTLYQYDGIDKLDVRHDRYTGNWSGIIRGSEYLAEKDLVLPYDVVLADGKVVKAGDQIVKGSAYAFKFEFDQSTNSDFIKKIVKVTWNEKDGKWAYTIDKEFLNSLGVQGTFDADFYIEVERIASGKVENKFVNIVNGQEMEAKVVTHTPEVPNSPELPKLPNPVKPTEPSKTVEPSKSVESVKQEQSVELKELPNTGTDASSLGLIGTAILSVLGLAGLKRKKY
jgi:cell surface protein B